MSDQTQKVFSVLAPKEIRRSEGIHRLAVLQNSVPLQLSVLIGADWRATVVCSSQRAQVLSHTLCVKPVVKRVKTKWYWYKMRYMNPPPQVCMQRGPDNDQGLPIGSPERCAEVGSGGRTRTDDLKVMSLASCHLLHPAVMRANVRAVLIWSRGGLNLCPSNPRFSNKTGFSASFMAKMGIGSYPSNNSRSRLRLRRASASRGLPQSVQ